MTRFLNWLTGRKPPTIHHKLLAVHMANAESRSAML